MEDTNVMETVTEVAEDVVETGMELANETKDAIIEDDSNDTAKVIGGVVLGVVAVVGGQKLYKWFKNKKQKKGKVEVEVVEED